MNGTGVPSGIETGSVRIRAAGATAVVVRLNDAGVELPWPSLAVIVTVWLGASSEAGAVHDQVPVLVPVLVTVPEEAASATVSPSGSAKVPVLVGAEPSATLTAALSAPIAGARLTFVVTHVLKAKSCPHEGPVNHAQPLHETYSWPAG